MTTFAGTRPDDDALARYTEAWETKASLHLDVQRMLRNADDSKAEESIRTLFVAGCHLEDCLVTLGAPKGFRNDWCFKFGRLCFGRPDPWEVFDRVDRKSVV